jgi:transcriptional regulator PpsR
VAAKVVWAAADIALVVDRQGVIQDLLYADGAADDRIDEGWRGRPWTETVTSESRVKVEELLAGAASDAAPRWREVNHTVRNGRQLPVRYSAVGVGGDRVLALGRDLSTVAALQQRVLDVQQSMEREFARLRKAEIRYRLLFQLTAESVLLVGADQRIVEANAAMGRLIGVDAARLPGRLVLDVFDDESTIAVRDLIATARLTPRPPPITVRLSGVPGPHELAAAQFRQDGAAHLLLRITPPRAEGAALPAAQDAPPVRSVARILAALPDAFVVTDPERRIVDCNRAFLDMAELSSAEHARGQPLERWLGRPGVDMQVLTANLREHGVVRAFGTVLRGEFGGQDEVEVTAVAALDSESPTMGFVVRRLARRRNGAPRRDVDLPSSAEQLTDLIGKVPLKQIVGETTDVIERLCIEAALKLTRDNRASAAQILGLSRQSLYSKLRRFGLGGLEDMDTAPGN